jgi:cobalt/nickel transport system permease protein
MGVTAAFVFAAQLINFPVAGGTSGHLVGGVLAAVLLGPSAAVIVMTAVLTMQCLVFGDGGLLSLGANILNMGVIHPMVGFAVYKVVVGLPSARRPGDVRRVAAVAFASWVATVVAAATCAGELALSGVAAPGLVLLAMVGVHLAIGLGEALITALVVASILRLDRALLERPRAASPLSSSPVVVLGLAASLGVALFLSPFACPWPDGLGRVVARLGVEPARARVSLPVPLRDYTIPGLAGSLWAPSLAAAAGTLLVFGLCCAIAFWLVPRRARGASGELDDGRAATSPPRP